MNLACSYLRPIEGRLKEVIMQAAQSQKIRLDVSLGKQMMNELKFYAPDPTTLGSDTEEEIDDSAQQNQISKMLAGGLDGEDEDEKSLIDKVMDGINSADTNKERQELYDTELNIEEYKMDTEAQTCMTDFYRKPYAEADDKRISEEEKNEGEVPIDFYDNEDGFWDNYIEEK